MTTSPRSFDFKKSKTHHRKTLESLPNDLLVDISSCIGSSSLKHIRNFRLVSKSIRNLCDDPYVIKNLSLQDVPVFPWFHDIEKFSNFLKRCRINGHPEALYRKGLIDYFQNNCEEKGLKRLEEAAKNGVQDAKYIYGIILICRGGETKQKGFNILSSLNKPLMSSTIPYLEEIRSKIINLISWHGTPVIRDLKISYVQENCNCNGETRSFLVKNGIWHQYGADHDMKTSSACNVCLWHREVTLFFKDIDV